MTARHEENPPDRAPSPRARTDASADMRTAPQGSRFGPDDFSDPGRALEALARWDELDRDTLSALERHPTHGPRLAKLRAAELWLEDQALEARAALTPGACPSAEELYDFGRGPGYQPLSAERRRQLDDHVHRCLSCERVVDSLSAPPPLPLDWSELSELALSSPALPDSSGKDAQGRASAPIEPELVWPPTSQRTTAIPTAPVHSTPRTAARGPRRWVPLAAAAVVVLGVGLWVAQNSRESRGAGPREDPLLRGRSAELLLFPRERLLPPTSTLHRLWPALDAGTSFEIAGAAEAQGYRVELERHAGGAFERGQTLASGRAIEPFVILSQRLEPGHYTWRAWLESRGLEQPLGARDFEVVDNPELETELAALASEPDEQRRTARALELLDRHGFRSDARALARTLPAGELRERWLAPVPGR